MVVIGSVSKQWEGIVIRGFLTLAGILSAAHCFAETPANPVFFRASFDGHVEGHLQEQTLEGEEKGLSFAGSDHSQALTVGAGTSVRYDLGKTFPSQAGALEIRFRPNFPQTADSPAREVASSVAVQRPEASCSTVAC